MLKYLIGIDVGGTNIKVMIMDTGLTVIGKRSFPTSAEDGYDMISDRIITNIDCMLAEKNIDRSSVMYLAMGLPGIVDRKAQKTIYLSKLKWDGFNPAAKLGQYYQVPTAIDNDANINALGEYAFGENGKKDLVLLTLGTGIGGGIIIDGKIFGGSSNIAAEIGHMTINAADDAECMCGKKGHFESYCSGFALRRDSLEMLADFPDSVLHKYIAEADGLYDNSMITRGVTENDELCKEIFDRYIRFFSIGVVNIMHLLNPEIILIGGGISNAGEILLNPLNKMCRQLVIHERAFCPVVRASLGSEAGMYGACVLAAQMTGVYRAGS
ncbi:ROK family protein [Lachnospiraceae bacterium KK002]